MPSEGLCAQLTNVQTAGGCSVCPCNPQAKKQYSFYRCWVYFPVAMLRASSLAFSISPLRKNRAWREAGDPTHRRGDHAVLQMHPDSLAAIRVCKGSTVGKICQYSGYVRKIKGPDFISFLGLVV